MKNHISALVFFIFLTSISYGQDNSLGAFVAMPVGKFASKSIKDGGGFAKTGWGLVFDSRTAIKAVPNLSLYSHSTYQWNEMDSEAIESAFNTELSPYRVTVTNSKYSPLLTTIGPAYQFKFGKASLGVNGTLGVLFNNTKAFTVLLYDQSGTKVGTEIVNFDNHVAFAYTFGADIKFGIIPDLLSMALYADYTSANQKTELSFSTSDAVSSFQNLRYLNLGFKLVVSKTK